MSRGLVLAGLGVLAFSVSLLSMVWAALLLGEVVTVEAVVAAVAVLACVVLTQRAR